MKQSNYWRRCIWRSSSAYLLTLAVARDIDELRAEGPAGDEQATCKLLPGQVRCRAHYLALSQ